MRVAFFGTPDFAVPALEALADKHDLVLVLTRPDAVRSRGKKLVPSPVKTRALELGLKLVETQRITPEINAELVSLDIDFITVAAFGCIIPESTLSIPRYDSLNIHGSLLPRWRGAAPIQRAILAGDERIGISIMRVVKELDAGPYCRQASVDASNMGADELSAQLTTLGAQELLAAIDEIAAGTVQWTEQNEAEVSYAEKIDKRELLLSPELTAQENLLRIRASSDAAPARMSIEGRGLRVTLAKLSDKKLEPAEVHIEDKRFYLGCATGALELLKLKPDGKREMEAPAYIAGLRSSKAEHTGQAASLSWSAL